MKVNAWKNVDVECEVEVDLDDCIVELLNIADSEDGRRRKISAVDGATKILERITPQVVAELFRANPLAVEMLRARLAGWMEFLGPSSNGSAQATAPTVATIREISAGLSVRATKALSRLGLLGKNRSELISISAEDWTHIKDVGKVTLEELAEWADKNGIQHQICPKMMA